MKRTTLTWTLGLLLGACTGGTSSNDGTDAGTGNNPPTDASVVVPDASQPMDAAMSLDAATVPDASVPDAATATDAAVPMDAAVTPDAAVTADAGVTPCPQGVVCVDSFPFHYEGDTSTQPAGVLDHYSCAPNTAEGGPEVVFRVAVPSSGFLSAAVYDGTGVDIDVQILSALDAQACVHRGDLQARADVTAGYWYIVADSYVSGGVAQAGAFTLDIGFTVPSSGPCDLQVGTMARVGDNGVHLAMPATGPMVKEAHLVSAQEPAPFPATSTDELAAHYALSQQVTGFVMHRQEVWAPLEGGSFYGAGIGDPSLFPAAHEAWYVNMYWTSAARPARGTRMIVRDANGGSRAVVVAAGYETGPGDLSAVGGTPEETHFYMHTGHLDSMTLGIAVDQTLPLGPRTCQ